MTETRSFAFPHGAAAMCVAGPQEAHLPLLQTLTGCQWRLRGTELQVVGPQTEPALQLVAALRPFWQGDRPLTEADIRAAWQAVQEDRVQAWQERPMLTRDRRGSPIQARTLNQQRYVEAMETHTLTFGIGPAGTGKTYLAAMAAVRALQQRQVDRLVLTRPAVEAGERLGFLPGDLQQKIDPYLRPLYDALHSAIDPDKIPQMLERGTLEIAPLAYMRGRTLERAFVIVDEAQNTTPSQMKMILTRLGLGSRMVVTGDVTQVDLPNPRQSGLLSVANVLQGVPEVAFVYFDQGDVVRHPLVQRIVEAYEAAG